MCWFVFLLLPHDHEVAAAVPDIACMLHSEERTAGMRPEVSTPPLSGKWKLFQKPHSADPYTFLDQHHVACHPQLEEVNNRCTRMPASLPTAHPTARQPCQLSLTPGRWSLLGYLCSTRGSCLSPVSRQVSDLTHPCRAWDLGLTSIAGTGRL